MKRIAVAVVLLAACVLGASVHAHHSFAASYLENESVTIEGQLVQFQLRNPHSFVQMIVRERDGRDVRYAVEWRGAGELVTQGVTNGTLQSRRSSRDHRQSLAQRDRSSRPASAPRPSARRVRLGRPLEVARPAS